MFKKINILLVLLLLLVSVGAVSAADDLNDTIASDDKAVLEEVATDDVSTSVEEDEVVSSSSHTVNSSNYGTYFGSDGEVTSSVNSGDTISLDGDFSNKNFTFRVPVNVVGTSSNNMKNSVFTFYGGASGSNISNLNIANNKMYHYGIFLNGASNCVISGCTIKNSATSAYAICVANGANYNNVTDNDLATSGVKEGYTTWSTTPLLLSGAHYNYIANNHVSCGDTNAIYLSSYPGGPLKGGNSNFNVILKSISF